MLLATSRSENPSIDAEKRRENEFFNLLIVDARHNKVYGDHYVDSVWPATNDFRRESVRTRSVASRRACWYRTRSATTASEGSSGHVRQGRFKSPVIQDDDHLMTVLRYIEANDVACADSRA